MTFYSPTETQFTRHYREEVEMALSAVDCVLNGEKAVYASTELTSGRRLYDQLRAHALRTAPELRSLKGSDWCDANLWLKNVGAANEFARSVRGTIGNASLVITPAPFAAPGWSQPEYLAFWETLLRTRISAVWFNDNWQFSNGCTFEFAVAQDAGLPLFRADGTPLGLREGIALVEDAVSWLSSEGIDASKLEENLARLRTLTPQAFSA